MMSDPSKAFEKWWRRCSVYGLSAWALPTVEAIAWKAWKAGIRDYKKKKKKKRERE